MKKNNLLIIDDEIDILDILKERLKDCADEIFTETDGHKAVELIRTNKIQCVVCDIKMPVMSGVEIIKMVRGDKNEIPFIFYTGHGNQELMLEVAKYGAFDFIDKPNMDGVEDAVSRALNYTNNTLNNPDKPTLEEDFSEYQKLLKQLKD